MVNTNAETTLLRFPDLVARRIVSNRMTLKRWMARADNPFPQPIIITRSSRQPECIAWRESDIAEWLDSLPRGGAK